MELPKETIYPPMKTPRGWFVLYQGAYAMPNIFNLHERGIFKIRPRTASELGARILVSEEFRVAVQYMRLIDSVSIDETTGERYAAMIERGLVPLADNFALDTNELEKIIGDKDIKDEIIKVYNGWLSTVPKGQEPNTPEMKRSLAPHVERGRNTYHDWLIRNNSPWLIPFLPGMVHEFMHGIYERVTDQLYNFYKQAGGDDPEDDLIKKINMFSRIYQSEGLIKPEGTPWISEDEIWDCWVAFSGSEAEAKRICRTLEAILLPLREELKKELGS